MTDKLARIKISKSELKVPVSDLESQLKEGLILNFVKEEMARAGEERLEKTTSVGQPTNRLQELESLVRSSPSFEHSLVTLSKHFFGKVVHREDGGQSEKNYIWLASNLRTIRKKISKETGKRWDRFWDEIDGERGVKFRLADKK